jgi:kynurenine formamidase
VLDDSTAPAISEDFQMYDLTQPLTPDIPRFPDDPEVRIQPIHDFAPWQISALTMGTHSGTHMDAPRHCIPDGPGIGHYGPRRLVGDGLVIEASGYGENAAVPAAILEVVRDLTWPGWFAVLRTGWDKHWGDDTYFRHPYLSPALARVLVDSGAGIVAIDTLSVDSTVDAGSAAHELLLGADILIAENLCHLDALQPKTRYAFAFLPLSLAEADGSPARVVAWDSAHPVR